MSKARHASLALGALAAAVVALACRESATSPTRDGGTINAGVKQPPGKGGGECANFRLTGGGRVDARDHNGYAKSTPESHDFATFGFQARPAQSCSEGEGSGNMTWQEHYPNEFSEGFTFHGRVTFFTTPTEAGLDGQCGRFGGFGRLKARNGYTWENVPFEVNHACDVAEPGVGNDHIKITVGSINTTGTVYTRHGILSGGNIQWHRLTGNN